MCIPPLAENPEPYFSNMVKLRDSLDKKLLLSMGMSSDYQLSLKYRSNMIRIGSKIFS
jgi:uncharacterized pyridoxal phosphate-containing UPF0001 family protein